MERLLKAIALWFIFEVVIPCLYFALTEGTDAAIAYSVIALVIFALSAPFILLSIPLWIKARKLLENLPGDRSQKLD